MFMSSTVLTREDLVQVQVDNVINFAHSKLCSVIRHSIAFLSIVLSLNTTLYQNTELTLQHLSPSLSAHQSQQPGLHRAPSAIMASPSFCELFCQYHLGVFPYKAIDIMGLNYTRAINNCKALLNIVLTKIGKLKIMQQRTINGGILNAVGLSKGNEMKDVV